MFLILWICKVGQFSHVDDQLDCKSLRLLLLSPRPWCSFLDLELKVDIHKFQFIIQVYFILESRSKDSIRPAFHSSKHSYISWPPRRQIFEKSPPLKVLETRTPSAGNIRLPVFWGIKLQCKCQEFPLLFGLFVS